MEKTKKPIIGIQKEAILTMFMINLALGMYLFGFGSIIDMNFSKSIIPQPYIEILMYSLFGIGIFISLYCDYLFFRHYEFIRSVKT